MDKIVIMNDAPAGKSPLIKSIRRMFPECRIQVVPNKHAESEDLSAGSSQETEHNGCKKDGNRCGG